MRVYLGVAAAMVAFASLAEAGPLDLKEISAEAKWVPTSTPTP